MQTTFSKSKYTIFSCLILVISFSSCDNESNDSKSSETSTLTQNNRFSQDLGSIMLDIQARHAKIYYAGKNENWELAGYLTQELKESFKDITTHHRSHDEVNLNKLTNQMMMPTIEELEISIIGESLVAFNSSYDKLTISCNNCHAKANHSFIKIKKPMDGEFLNQKFIK